MKILNSVIAVGLCLFTLWEVNYPMLQPQSSLAVFAMSGLVLCFLNFPLHKKWKDQRWTRGVDVVSAVLAVLCCGFIIAQTEPLFEFFWLDGQPLGNRPGQETGLDFGMAIVLLFLVLDAAPSLHGLGPAHTCPFVFGLRVIRTSPAELVDSSSGL